LPYLVGLSKYGYRIVIISAEKKDNYVQRSALIEQIIQAHRLVWEPVFYTKKPPVVSTLWDIYHIRQKAFKLHKIHKFRIIHCRSYITALVGLSLKRKKGIRFIFDMRGFWADERVEGGLWNLNNQLYKKVYLYFKRKEKEFLREADYTVSLTHGAKEIIHGWPGLESVPIQVIPCCVDTELFNAKPPLSQTLPNIKQMFTLSYLGSLGTWYMLDDMLHFFKRLLLKKPDALFLFITPDDPQLILQKAASINIPTDKFIIRKAERKEVPQLLATCHMSIFFIKPSYSKKASSPTKMGEILSMGIPVVCNSGVGDTNYLFSTYTPGILIDQLDDENYDKAIASIDEAAQIAPQRLRNVALAYFALEKGINLYHQIYQKLLS
jgi:glycosyltransferase involved in cell wall biosynthesis